MVGVHVGIKYVRDLQSFFLSEGGIGFDVTLLRVDDRALPNGPSAKGVGRATCVEVIERLENHCANSSIAWNASPPVLQSPPSQRRAGRAANICRPARFSVHLQGLAALLLSCPAFAVTAR
jgi:hypothetical protein